MVPAFGGTLDGPLEYLTCLNQGGTRVASFLVEDCPRCGAKSVTFDVLAHQKLDPSPEGRLRFEGYSVCRACVRGTTFVVAQTDPNFTQNLRQQGLSMPGNLRTFMAVEGYVSIRETVAVRPPEHVPPDVADAFNEGATCLAVECFNAASAMFRLAVDLATRPLLPPETDTSINSRQRRDLGLRLAWMFDNGKLAPELRELSKAIREDGNDGVHRGTLTKPDAEDLLDFAVRLLERMFTEPERLRLAEVRRQSRRQQPNP
jgi:hypothetical protein